MNHHTKTSSATIVMFGATGDLAKRKLFPSLFRLFSRGLLPSRFGLIGVGRKPYSTLEFQNYVHETLKKFAHLTTQDESQQNKFVSSIEYAQVDLNETANYANLLDRIVSIEATQGLDGNRLFYLSLAPDLFGPVTIHIRDAGLLSTTGWNRLVIEKPFGHNYESASALNEQIRQVFAEEDIYRIDHYLGKEMVQSIEVIRFANSIFEPLWNNKHIASVDVIASETVGIEDRASYYEHAGALRDMVQNHMLQMVMMVAMEPPSRLVNEAVRDEKVKVLRSLRRYYEADVDHHVVRGQYTEGTIDGRSVSSYRAEQGVAPHSLTETFVAAKLHIDNFRWAGVPFYVRTGKRLTRKATDIFIRFHQLPENLYFNKKGALASNVLGIRIYPEEAIFLTVNTKKQGTEGGIVPIELDFCQTCEVGQESPDAYETLIYDCLEGDSTYFTRWDEVSLAWKFVDPIAAHWRDHPNTLYHYAAGSWGPVEANSLRGQESNLV